MTIPAKSKPLVLQLGDFPCSAHWKAQLENDTQVVLLNGQETTSLKAFEPKTDVHALLTLISTPLSAEALSMFPNLRVISNYGSGLNHLPLDEIRRRGIILSNTPGVLSDAVADLTWGLLLTVARKMHLSDREIREGVFPAWNPFHITGLSLQGKTLGLVGYGAIAKAVAKRADAFGMRVIHTSRSGGETLETVLSTADVVSLHLPLSPETHHLMNIARLRQMKPGSILINTARGALVDEAALVSVLNEGHLWGAGLDVFEHEPDVPAFLKTCPHVFMTAHIGSATQDAREAMGNLAIENLLHEKRLFSGTWLL